MLNYMSADLRRISKRVPRIVLMLVSFLVFCIAISILVSFLDLLSDPMMEQAGLSEIGLTIDNSSAAVFDAICQAAGYAAGIIGLFELIFVFSDDIKAKTTQIAIGVGVSRGKIVLTKFFELLILLVIDMVIMTVLGTVMSRFVGLPLSFESVMQLLKEMSVSMLLYNLSYASIVFILLFTTQSISQVIICFLALNFHVVSGAISLSSNVKALAPLNLGKYTLTTQLEGIAEIVSGAATFDIVPFIGCLAYVVVALGLTVVLFKKKELEF